MTGTQRFQSKPMHAITYFLNAALIYCSISKNMYSFSYITHISSSPNKQLKILNSNKSDIPIVGLNKIKHKIRLMARIYNSSFNYPVTFLETVQSNWLMTLLITLSTVLL